MVVHSACLTVTETNSGVRARGTVAVLHDGSCTRFDITWPRVRKQDKGVDPGTWLLRILSAIVEDFDVHELSRFDLTGVQDMQEDSRG